MKNSVKKKIDSKYIINLIFILIVVIISTFTYSRYQNINKIIQKEDRNVFEDSRVLESFNRFKLFYAFELLENTDEYKDKIIKLLPEQYSSVDDFIEEKKSNNKSFISSNYSNMHTFVSKIDDEKNFFRNMSNIENLTDDDIKKSYDFYIDFEFNEMGVLAINKIFGANKTHYERELKKKTFENSEVEIQDIKNIRYVFAYPKNVSGFGEIEYIKADYYEDNALMLLSLYFSILVVVIIIAALIIPFKYSKKVIGIKYINKIYFEAVLIIVFLVCMSLFPYFYFAQNVLIGNEIKEFLKEILFITNTGVVIDFINTAYIVIFIYVMFSIIVYIKNIFNIGCINFANQKILIFKLVKKIYNLLKIINCNVKLKLKALTEIDFKDEDKQKIIIIVILNFVMLTIISFTWMFAFIPLAIYSAILFIYINKKYDEYKSKYNKLNMAIDKIGKENFNITIEEDIKPFNKIKEKLCNIDKEFSEAVESEIKSNNMKTELISNVSHDLKTPLTSIVSYVDLLKDENLTKETRKEYLDILDRKSLRLTELIENLFEVSRATTGDIKLNYDYINIVELLKQAILEFEDRFFEKKLSIKSNFSDEKIILNLDGQIIFRVFENLLSNITKYSMVGSRVYIDVKKSDDKVVIILKNMAEDELNFSSDEIVERFIRGDKSRNTEGSGLGLAIAKNFIEIQNGKFEVNVDGDLFKTSISFNKLK